MPPEWEAKPGQLHFLEGDVEEAYIGKAPQIVEPEEESSEGTTVAEKKPQRYMVIKAKPDPRFDQAETPVRLVIEKPTYHMLRHVRPLLAFT